VPIEIIGIYVELISIGKVAAVRTDTSLSKEHDRWESGIIGTSWRDTLLARRDERDITA